MSDYAQQAEAEIWDAIVAQAIDEKAAELKRRREVAPIGETFDSYQELSDTMHARAAARELEPVTPRPPEVMHLHVSW